jgi:RHS repeat-associated protein
MSIVADVTRAYDAENRMTSETQARSYVAGVYTYNADGQRVRRKVAVAGQPAVETWQVYGFDGELLAEYAKQGAATAPQKEYGYRNGQLLLTAEPKDGNPNLQWLVTDQLGTPRMIFDKTGSLAGVKRHDYLPFGEEIFADTGGRTTTMGYTPPGNNAADGARQKFTSKERDTETGLDYFLARFYSSPQGRFTSPDEFKGGPDELYVLGSGDQQRQALPYAEITQPESLNKYSYTYNNPLRFVDSDGHCGTPSGLKPGQVGICVASFIKTKIFSPIPGMIGPGRGDGRGANGQGGTSRVEVRVAVDVSKGTVTKTDETMGRSGIGFKGLGLQGSGGSQVSEPSKDKQGNVYFQIAQHGDSAMNVGNLIGTIDNHLNMVVTPENKVGITPSSTAKDYPSLEVFKYTMDDKGKVTTTPVIVKEEAGSAALKSSEQPLKAAPQ